MKRHITYIILLLCCSISSFAQKNSKNYILTLSVDLYMNTSSRVSCDNFATIFEKVLTINTVYQTDSIAMFSAFVRNAKYSRYDKAIDVRRKFIYEIEGSSKIIVCSDGRNILLNGKMVKRNKKFINFLNSLCGKNSISEIYNHF